MKIKQTKIVTRVDGILIIEVIILSQCMFKLLSFLSHFDYRIAALQKCGA